MTTSKSAEARKLEAVDAEPEAQLVEIEHDGITYKLDDDQFGLDALEELSTDPIGTLREWFGDEQWSKFRESVAGQGGRAERASFNRLLKTVMAAVGKLQ